MARICPALQQLLNTKEISTLENLSSTPRRKPIKWTVNVGVDRRLFTITATIERMNRRIGAGLPLSTMAKRDGKHKSGMPVVWAAAIAAKAPKAPKGKAVKSPKPVKVGQWLTLTAIGVTDANGNNTLNSVWFYRDNDKVGILDGLPTPPAIGVVSSIVAGVWSLRVLVDPSWATGKQKVFARALDNLNTVGNWVSFTIDVQA